MFKKFLMVLILFSCCGVDVALAKARFALKKEMIKESDLIAVVEVKEVKDLEPEKMCGLRQARATVETVLKGKAGKKISFMAPCFYPCAVTHISPGRQIIFLKKDRKEWVGTNWQYSYRPIKGRDVEWYLDEGAIQLGLKSLDEVLAEIKSILKQK